MVPPVTLRANVKNRVPQIRAENSRRYCGVEAKKPKRKTQKSNRTTPTIRVTITALIILSMLFMSNTLVPLL